MWTAWLSKTGLSAALISSRLSRCAVIFFSVERMPQDLATLAFCTLYTFLAATLSNPRTSIFKCGSWIRRSTDPEHTPKSSNITLGNFVTSTPESTHIWFCTIHILGKEFRFNALLLQPWLSKSSANASVYAFLSPGAESYDVVGTVQHDLSKACKPILT